MAQPVPGEVLCDETVAPGAPWWRRLEAGEVLRIVDLHGRQGVDFLCYHADAAGERYHAPNTMKAARSIHIGVGVVLYSDVARPLMRVVADTCGGHDTLGGCCSAESNRMLYGVEHVPGCRENFLAVLAANGMDRRDIVPNINFFCRVPVAPGGRLAESVFVPGRSVAGDYVELQAETAVLCVLSNCPQVNNPCNDGVPTPVRVLAYR